ncbi:hypothetical protein BDL97_16G037200 [Sphagnum fallax]|nr:hypothetical protein BDL97_16G037200 [Sphagnum fallax]
MKKKKLRFLAYPSFFIMSSLSLSLSLCKWLYVFLRVFLLFYFQVPPIILILAPIHLFIYLCFLQLIAPTKPCLALNMMWSKHISGCPHVNGNKVVVDLFFSCLLQDTTNTQPHHGKNKFLLL